MNRWLLVESVRWLAQEAGIRQFLDIGSGLPTQQNVHEVAQSIDKNARVVYVDNDPLVRVHAETLLATDPNTIVIEADVRDPKALLDRPEIREHLDFSRPIGLLLVAVLHFVEDTEQAYEIVRTFCDAMPSGSYLVLSHVSSDGMAESVKEQGLAVYNRASAGMFPRTRDEIAGFFTGLTPVGDGPALLADWKLPGSPDGLAGNGDVADLPKFSFFVTSLAAMRELSGSQNGFGGDLRYGETGAGAGLKGADKICTQIAEKSMPGSGKKVWRAFLSATKGGANGGAVHARDRIGEGPWYDRVGRLVAQDLTGLLKTRPDADAKIKDDLPNEDGVPNHKPDPTMAAVDNHHVLTGSDGEGHLYANNTRVTCGDWTDATSSVGEHAPRVGLSWPRGGGGGGFPGPGGTSGQHWFSAMDEAGCNPGVNIVEQGPPNQNNPSVGSGGGYGAIYCFALTP